VPEYRKIVGQSVRDFDQGEMVGYLIVSLSTVYELGRNLSLQCDVGQFLRGEVSDMELNYSRMSIGTIFWS
jgi:hypothetical protein